MNKHEYGATIILENALTGCRQQANMSRPMKAMFDWYEGKVESVRIIFLNEELALDALGVLNEINFLREYAKRHGKFL